MISNHYQPLFQTLSTMISNIIMNHYQPLLPIINHIFLPWWNLPLPHVLLTGSDGRRAQDDVGREPLALGLRQHLDGGLPSSSSLQAWEGSLVPGAQVVDEPATSSHKTSGKMLPNVTSNNMQQWDMDELTTIGLRYAANKDLIQLCNTADNFWTWKYATI